MRDGDRYIMSCTSGNAANAFALFESTDLVSWKAKGHILPAAARPAWAKSDFWAPEIHPVGTKWLAYWSARGADGKLSIGAASADDPLGPYTALPQPIVPATTVGLIDAHAFTANGVSYLLWKDDGNAQNAPTPIRARQLSADGLSLTGPTVTLITNTLAWEGNLVEGPWVTPHDGSYYLFYSGYAYYDGRYAVGVAARARRSVRIRRRPHRSSSRAATGSGPATIQWSPVPAATSTSSITRGRPDTSTAPATVASSSSIRSCGVMAGLWCPAHRRRRRDRCLSQRAMLRAEVFTPNTPTMMAPAKSHDDQPASTPKAGPVGFIDRKTMDAAIATPSAELRDRREPLARDHDHREQDTGADQAERERRDSHRREHARHALLTALARSCHDRRVRPDFRRRYRATIDRSATDEPR